MQTLFRDNSIELALRGPIACLIVCMIGSLVTVSAQQPDSLAPNRLNTVTARVSPVLEIELLDPNKDARGNPAIVTKTDASGNTQIEIPPTLIVHRYYYSGDRSFRGPDFPGGPSIVIAQNPRDGQQVYLPVQMLPGSPVVHYTSRSIEYDFGNRAVIVTFPVVGEPTVSYRNGRPISEKASKLLGVDRARTAWQGTKENFAAAKQKASTAAKATSQFAGNLFRPLTLPAQNLARLMPGNAALTDPNLEAKINEQSAVDARQRAIDQARKQVRTASVDIPVQR